ncbi:MAG: hypothetical protein Q8Q06_01835 [bacterium]|nr:hypothetical protein [bacterium]
MSQDNYYNQLALVRAGQKDTEDIKARANEIIRPPSKFKYGVMFLFAGIGDLVDLADFTGVGIIISIIVDLIIGAILFILAWMTRTKMRKITDLHKSVQENILNIERRIAGLRNAYATALRAGRRFKTLRRPIRVAAKKFKQFRALVYRNPLMKNAIAIFADLIPFIGLLPSRLIAIYFTYQDEKKTYLAAKEILPEYEDAKNEELSELQEYSAIMAEEEAQATNY